MAKRERPSVERLRELLEYDPETGELRWINSKGAGKAGRRVGGTCKIRGYSYLCVDYCQLLAHRVAWAVYYGEWPPDDVEIDHVNGVKDDNSIGNLRLCNRSENSSNTRTRTDNTSGYKGVYFHRRAGKWLAQIWSEGKYHYLGLYPTPEEAHAAYCKAAHELHGEFARVA